MTSSKRKTPKRRPLRWLWLSLGLTGVAITSAAAGALLAVGLASTPLLQSQLSPEEEEVFSQGDRISTGVNFRLPRLTRPVNILVLGVKVLTSDIDDPVYDSDDLGYHALVNSFEGLSDTMLLIRLNPEGEQLTVLSLPRDTRTLVEDVGYTKLNEANRVGGPATSAIAVSDLLGGVEIDRYVRINVQGVEKLIDALGGVTLYVPQDMKYQDDSQHLYINLQQGEQHLDGAEAMQFLRFRYDAYGDIGRVQRQQTLMRALQEQTLDPSTIARLPQILSVIQSHVDTNLSVEELLALVGFAAGVERSEVQMLMLPGDFSRSEQYSLSYWLPSQTGIRNLVAEYFDPGGLSLDEGDRVSRLANSDDVDHRFLRIAIQDSTNDEDAVDAVLAALSAKDYRNVHLGNDWGEPLAETRIIAQKGDRMSATLLQRQLGFGEVRTESTGILDSDITIQLGQDWQQHEF
ncbi:MAG: LCP family protein [Merismopedia sp. SIO2A8]|nr:LCP family protein [Symploca sp. SIO2B6]NET50284.1 LCP family protein [Merismopedia sp. SIO2A8]